MLLRMCARFSYRLTSVVWATLFCSYIWIKEGREEKVAVSYYGANSKRLLFGSPKLSFYAIEWATALTIAFLFAAAISVIKKMLF